MVQDLYFKYEGTSRIRIKKANVLVNDTMPGVFRVTTQKLDFMIPEQLVIFEGEYAFIPNSFYQRVLEKLYFRRAGLG